MKKGGRLGSASLGKMEFKIFVRTNIRERSASKIFPLEKTKHETGDITKRGGRKSQK